jgi:uncharacterized protein
MKKITVLLMAVVVGISLAACQDDDEGSKGVFYTVSDGEQTAYLFGSIHVGTEDFYPLHNSVDQAYEAADKLAVEADPSEVGPIGMMELIEEVGVYADGETIQDYISDDMYADLEAQLQQLGIPMSEFERYKMWFVAVSLELFPLLEMGYSAELGIDQYFLDQAEEDGKDVVELESMEFQMNFMNQLSEDDQMDYLQSVLDNLQNMDEYEAEIEEMFDTWMTGDIDTFAAFRDEAEESDPAQWLTVERDKGMAEKIEEFLQEDETYFVVVGALHLVGEQSIPDLLESKGYTVEEGW